MIFVRALVLLALCSAAIATADPSVPNTVGIVAPGEFAPPRAVPGQSGWLAVPQIRQETNLCVPTSAAMIMAYEGHDIPPRELKVWSRGREYDPAQPYNDFTITFFSDLLSGLRAHGFAWVSVLYGDNEQGLALGLAQLETRIDQGLPTMIDTSLYTGHTFVVAGYDLPRGVIIIRDPFIDPPGIREIGLADFGLIWNSSKVGSDVRAAVLARLSAAPVQVISN